jgi:small redox-active disulfide protein 2
MENKTMIIKILGSGCPNCKRLEENAKKAVEELGLKDVKIEHIYDLNKIISLGIMSTPALAVDEEVKIAGRVADVKEIKELLKSKKND